MILDQCIHDTHCRFQENLIIRARKAWWIKGITPAPKQFGIIWKVQIEVANIGFYFKKRILIYGKARNIQFIWHTYLNCTWSLVDLR